ncbi:hypothetical protein Pla110_23960 [Polystyrenella longa]|uniref:Gfo/Idh/MocA-like oxidoreductase N-terminal domain-containing protein n=1 Tax=Polystyrenella longa TaxID=2528007 RepID=A0A518CN95_9PLAN|nr:Gfo/Idh/MocA family oxidoreductase [Polystyrenella longa]QDU80664.1 hypothetical protein Pla110_23960 [Polystyrenella longa]
MIKFGVLGVGNEWDSTFQPALQQLRQRVQVRAIFDPVSARAMMAGRQLQAMLCDSVTSLLSLRELDAILVLNSSWYGESLLQFLLHFEKPCFLASNISVRRKSLRKMHGVAISQGQTLMPALKMRYTPSSGRLQELMETTLGPPSQIEVQIPGNLATCTSSDKILCPQDEMVVCLFDWCQHILKAVPLLVSPRDPVHTIQLDEVNRSFQISYSPCRRKNADSTSMTPQLILNFMPVDQNTTEFPRIEVTCSHGKAVLPDATHIEWNTENVSERESLVSDRSEFEVMLDHFCRRVVGGLIPVADLADYERSLRLHQAYKLSRERESSVSLLGKS